MTQKKNTLADDAYTVKKQNSFGEITTPYSRVETSGNKTRNDYF